VALAAGAASAAEHPPDGGIPDVTSARDLALSSGVAIATGNEGIYLNAGALAARKRYSLDVPVLWDRRGADTTGLFFGSSVVDSQSSPVTAGFSFLREQKGLYAGDLFHVALAGTPMEKLHLGATGKYYTLHGPTSTNIGTVDAGLLWEVAQWVTLGAAGYNLVPVANDAVAPLSASAGLAIGSDESFQVTGEWRGQFDRDGKTYNRYGGGAELLLGDAMASARFPIRAGFQKDDRLGSDWWSAGLGVVTRGGVAVDAGYRQATHDSSARTIAVGLRLFLFQ